MITAVSLEIKLNPRRLGFTVRYQFTFQVIFLFFAILSYIEQKTVNQGVYFGHV